MSLGSFRAKLLVLTIAIATVIGVLLLTLPPDGGSSGLTSVLKLQLIDIEKGKSASITERITLAAAVFSALLLLFDKIAKHFEINLNEETLKASTIGRAMELLGSSTDVTTSGTTVKLPNISARIGALAMLRRIALESPETHTLIMDAVAAYIKENTPLDSDVNNRVEDRWSVRPDILAAVRLIGDPDLAKYRRNNSRFLQKHISLKYCNLSNIDFSNLTLDAVEFCNSRLNGARFWGASLCSANFFKSILDDVDFGTMEPDHMFGVIFDGADLSKSKGISDEILKNCYGDSTTILSKNAERPTSSASDKIKFWIDYEAGSKSKGTDKDPICASRLENYAKNMYELRNTYNVRYAKLQKIKIDNFFSILRNRFPKKTDL